MAAKQANPEASRKLGTMYAKGDGGPRDREARDGTVDGRRKGRRSARVDPGGGPDVLRPDRGSHARTRQVRLSGRYPGGQIEVIEDWYGKLKQRDPRPEVKQRAQTALTVLAGFKKAAESAPRS